MFCFAVIDSLAILLIESIHVSQILAIRFWLFFAFALAYAKQRTGIRQALLTPIAKLQITRALLTVAEVGVFLVSLKFLQLAESHALFATFPIWALLLAAVFLREPLGRPEITGVLLGLAGTFIILRPGTGMFAIEALIPLTAAVLGALHQIVTRHVTQIDHSTTTLLYSGLVGAMTCSIVSYFFWVDASTQQWIIIFTMGVLGVIAQILLIAALTRTPASHLQPFNYTLLLFATCLGYFFFNQTPDLPTVIGGACITGAGLFVLVKRTAHQV
jgi:drug/metabolite transporter (DMT)-like permease